MNSMAGVAHAADALATIGWPVLDRVRIGPLQASPHGLGIAVGFLVGGWVLSRVAPRWSMTQDDVNSIITRSIIGAIIGARLFYVIGHFSEYGNLVEILQIWKGGISLLGGIAGATLLNLPYVRRRGFKFFQVADPVAICLALGISIGRIGDLVIGDHLGKPTSWLLAWAYRGGTLPGPWGPSPVNSEWSARLQGGHLETIDRLGATLCKGAETAVTCGTGSKIVAYGTGVHQTALYDMLIAGCLFGLLWSLGRSPRRAGVLTLTFGLVYGCSRLLEDSLRIDKTIGPLTGSQWTGLSVALVSASLLIWWALRPTSEPAPYYRDLTQEPVESAEHAPDDPVQTN